MAPWIVAVVRSPLFKQVVVAVLVTVASAYGEREN